MSETGHLRRIDTLATRAACPLCSGRSQICAMCRNDVECRLCCKSLAAFTVSRPIPLLAPMIGTPRHGVDTQGRTRPLTVMCDPGSRTARLQCFARGHCLPNVQKV